MMHIVACRWIGEIFIQQQGIRRLLEEKRRFAPGNAAHFSDMVIVIAPDTVNAPHRKAQMGAFYRH
jgi:hypothetical protein